MRREEFEVKNIPISFLDLEMTGLEGHRHEIVEIGLVKASQPDLKIIETWEIKVRPEKLSEADPIALKISGYDKEKWKDAVSLKEAMEALSFKISGTILAGWNVPVDYSFLDAAATRTGIHLDFHKHVLDVNSFSAGKLGLDKGFSGLTRISNVLGITVDVHHNALPDAMTCYEVYKRLVFG